MSYNWISKVACFFAVCFVVFTLALPSDAGAFAIVDATSNKAQKGNNTKRSTTMSSIILLLARINAIITQINTAIETVHFPLITESLKVLAKAEVDALKTLSKARVKMAQSQNDASVVATREEVVLKDIVNHVAPPHQQLCRALALSQGHKTIEAFEKSVVKMTSEALSNIGRGPKDDFSGPAYADFMERARCTYGFANELDGYKEVELVPLNAAVGTKPVACTLGAASSLPSKRSFADADLTPSTMDGSMALEIPPMVQKKNGVKMAVLMPKPDMSNDNQRFWMAGFLFCSQLQGPRISPAWGKNINTPWGLSQQTQFSTGLARQNQANSACLKLLAYHTRPNTTDVTDAVKKDQKDLCDKARGYVSDAELTARFGNCEKGLSRYQTEYLQHRTCKTAQHYVEKRAGGRKTKHLPDDAIMCSASWMTWLATVERRQLALVDAVIGQLGVKNVWPSR